MPFELPNYVDVGKTLLTSAHSYSAGAAPQFSDHDADEYLKDCECSGIVGSSGQKEDLSGTLLALYLLGALLNSWF